MNVLATIFFACSSVALLTLPRRWAPIPLLVGCCYMTQAQGVSIVGLNFPIYRMLVAVGIFRVILRSETFSGRFSAVDKLVVFWGVWNMFASLFHKYAPGSGPQYASGIVFNVAGVYFLIRIWCRNVSELRTVVGWVAVILTPVALEMVFEKLTGRNLFSFFGGVSSNVLERGGRLRASGPFRHPILAGTVGAVCFPLMFGILKEKKLIGILGCVSCIAIVLASASSGPLMSLIFAIAVLGIWRLRHFTNHLVIGSCVLYLLVEIVSVKPAYFMLTKIDLTGGSTGRHRAELIDSFFKYFSEWWLFGTDYTRHWMQFGVSFSTDHTDITSYYIAFAVMGGLLALLSLLAILLLSFRDVGRARKILELTSKRDAFTAWCVGAGLVAHAATSVSVSYFDQSVTFIWFNIAIVGALSQTASDSLTSGSGSSSEEVTEVTEQLRNA